MKKFSQLALPYIIWSIIILLLPVLLIAFYAITDRGNTVVNFSFTLQNFVKFFTDPDFLLILWRSLSIALKTTIICILLGYPVAYFISRCKDRTRNILILLITLPMWINMLVRTYAWIGILSDGGILQSLLNLLGFKSTQLLYTEGAVLLGMVYNFLPFMILPIQVTLLPNYILLEKLKLLNSWKALIIPAIFSPFGTVWLTFVFQAIPDSTLDAARMDGVNQLQMIRYIIVPNSKPAVITLFILVFTESWNMVEQPILFLEKETDYPLSVFLASLNQNAVGIQSVCGLLCLLPVTFFFLYYNTELTDGLKDILWS